MTRAYRFLFVCLAGGTLFFHGGYATAQQSASADQQQDAPANSGATQEAVPERDTSRISDWAYAGVLWSDTHLVRAMAQVTETQSTSSDRMRQMRQLVERCDDLIQKLEAFGWKRLEQDKRARDEAVAERDATETVRPDAGPDVEITLQQDPYAEVAEIGHYRIHDYFDDATGEPRTRAEAAKDGAKKALAAGAGRLPEVASDRISRRETQTLSHSLPYGRGLIYDYYEDLDDLDSETIPTAREPQWGRPRIELERYTETVADHSVHDANWVQYRLEANQVRFAMVRDQLDAVTPEVLHAQVNAAVLQLRADAIAAARASNDSQLAEIVRQLP